MLTRTMKVSMRARAHSWQAQLCVQAAGSKTHTKDGGVDMAPQDSQTFRSDLSQLVQHQHRLESTEIKADVPIT